MWNGPSPKETLGAPGAPEAQGPQRGPWGPEISKNTQGHTEAWVLMVAGAKGVRAPGAPAGALST